MTSVSYAIYTLFRNVFFKDYNGIDKFNKYFLKETFVFFERPMN